MKIFLITVFCLGSLLSFAQKDAVSFVSTIKLSKATKEGIYLNGYMVHASYATLKKLNRKTVKITGKVTAIQPVSNSKTKLVTQGRAAITFHILHPVITVINL